MVCIKSMHKRKLWTEILWTKAQEHFLSLNIFCLFLFSVPFDHYSKQEEKLELSLIHRSHGCHWTVRPRGKARFSSLPLLMPVAILWHLLQWGCWVWHDLEAEKQQQWLYPLPSSKATAFSPRGKSFWKKRSCLTDLWSLQGSYTWKKVRKCLWRGGSRAWSLKCLGLSCLIFLLWENSLDHSEHEFFSLCFSANWVEFGVITDPAYFLRLPWFSSEIEQVAEWLWDHVDLWRLWRHEGCTVAISFHFCHDHTPPWVEGFFHQAPASRAPDFHLLVFLSSVRPGPSCPTEWISGDIGGAGSLREARSRRSWPQGNTVCRISQW